MRLELSKRTDLALRGLAVLQRRGDRVPRSGLAEEIGTSPDFLAKVLTPLLRSGWVGSEPGRGGGYTLSIDLDSVSMLDLVEISEGLPEPDRCVLRISECDAANPCALHEAWTSARQALYAELGSTSVADHTGE